MRRRRALLGWGALLVSAFLLAGTQHPAAAQRRTLRVCADPNNLPYSNQAQEGFENRIAEVLARALDADLSYYWWPQRRGFVRNTLREYRCDVVMGVPSSYELVLVTRPYYRSTYVFLTREDRGLEIASMDDPILRELKIGVHTMGDDYSNSPPAHALSNRKIIGEHIEGYSVYGNYNEPHPPSRLVDAVVNGEVDVAIVWGPIAGYFAREHPGVLRMVPVSPQIDVPFLPFVYDMAMGVRRSDPDLKEELEAAMQSHAEEIRAILLEYGVPLVERGQARTASTPGGN